MTGVLKRAAMFDRFLDGSVDISATVTCLCKGLINVSATAREKARSWDRQFARVCGWAELNGRLPGYEDEKGLYRWLDAQLGVYEIGELNVVQSRKLVRLVNRFWNRRRGHFRHRMAAVALGL